jgi:hypothetical protein
MDPITLNRKDRTKTSKYLFTKKIFILKLKHKIDRTIAAVTINDTNLLVLKMSKPKILINIKTITKDIAWLNFNNFKMPPINTYVVYTTLSLFYLRVIGKYLQ